MRAASPTPCSKARASRCRRSSRAETNSSKWRKTPPRDLKPRSRRGGAISPLSWLSRRNEQELQQMADISASMVMDLRQRTGLGMMECKKALTEAGGDLAKAEELLRIKSGAKASKAAGRVAAEGVIGAYLSPDAKLGALVELNCETDFVAKNDEFLAFAQSLAETVATQNPKDLAELASQKTEQRRQALVQKIGENISIRRLRRLPAKGRLALYLHGTKIGVLVDFEGAA